MRTLKEDVVFQEVPNEVSLLFQITGCPLRCKGCHSEELWDENNGAKLTDSYFEKKIIEYRSLITCVLFFGGEWDQAELVAKLKIAKRYGLKTCLYSGFNFISGPIYAYLDYLKIGPWREGRGGLDSRKTNQQFIQIETGNVLNYLFWKDEEENTIMEERHAYA